MDKAAVQQWITTVTDTIRGETESGPVSADRANELGKWAMETLKQARDSFVPATEAEAGEVTAMIQQAAGFVRTSLKPPTAATATPAPVAEPTIPQDEITEEPTPTVQVAPVETTPPPPVEPNPPINAPAPPTTAVEPTPDFAAPPQDFPPIIEPQTAAPVEPVTDSQDFPPPSSEPFTSQPPPPTSAPVSAFTNTPSTAGSAISRAAAVNIPSPIPDHQTVHPDPAGKSSGRLLWFGAVAAGVLLLVGGSVFALRSFGAQDGAENPQAAVDQMLEGLDNNNLLEIAELIEPSERASFARPALTEILPEMQRIGAIPDDVDAGNTQSSGLDISTEQVTSRIETLDGADDMVHVLSLIHISEPTRPY